MARLFSSKTSKVTSADKRLAGRLRFYKEVGVVEVAAPWKEQESESIPSPISAGVDGTDSASGVHHPTTSSAGSKWRDMLIPRQPGSVKLADRDSLVWFGVSLDGRTMKTPMGQTLAVPSQSLAFAIAAEWDAQVKHLQPANMPLMTLACTTLDQAAHHPRVYQAEALKFLPTDTTCFWADPTEDRVLHRRQEQAWKSLHDHIESRFDYPPAFALGANEAMIMARKRGDAKPIAGLPHPPVLVDRATEWVHGLDAWNLVALSSMCSQAKSFLVAFCLLDPESPARNMKDAIEASRVEEEFQISNWGLVEGGHDYDRLNCSIQLHSAQLFAKTIALDNDLY